MFNAFSVDFRLSLIVTASSRSREVCARVRTWQLQPRLAVACERVRVRARAIFSINIVNSIDRLIEQRVLLQMK